MNMNGLAEERSDYPAHSHKGRRMLHSFEELDALPKALRECAHEFGLPIVKACLQMNIREPRAIRYLVHNIWEGARQLNQKKQGVIGSLDWLLIQAGAQINAATLLRLLANSDLCIIPREPSPPMVNASMDAVNHMGVVSKSTKHRNRLRAAIKAGALGASS